ncbi:hypothetical protein [Agreia sp. COWG]|uniref:hypothetical protein n=1 Tax=Agreia sp. COWG TaxID=2773266 RepID=UPI00192856B9|nr:hypothetical protein [Agreia sp. COWG]CAD6011035.1 membrane protein of unknown function [Agreia sp. COWG]
MSATPEAPKAYPLINTVLLLIAQPIAALFCQIGVLFELFRFDACQRSCDAGLGNVAFYGMFAVSVLMLAASITLTVISRRRGRRTVFIPLAGLAVMTGAFIIALLLIGEATA